MTMTFKDIRRGDQFRVDKQYDDEWFLRGDWIKTNRKTSRGTLCVCLTQGNNCEGETKVWSDDIPVQLVKERHACSRKDD